MINPAYSKFTTQNPIISRAPKPAIANAGNAQKGWIKFVQASPTQWPLLFLQQVHQVQRQLES